MPRQHRLETNDGLYHIINRGNYRSWIFETEGAKVAFKSVLFEACEKFGWELSAYCVMSNHFHLCLGTPRGNLSSGMRWLQATFAMRFNRYRKESGHLFQGRFKSMLVEPGKHWRDLVDYIHLNPARAGLVGISELKGYPWTSLCEFPKRKSRAGFFDCRWMDYDELLTDSQGGWRRYSKALLLQGEEDPEELKKLEGRLCRGWCIGGREFKEGIAKDLLGRPLAVRLEKDQLADLNRSQWEVLLKEMLDALELGESDIRLERRAPAWKKAIASRLRDVSSVSSAWLGERLKLGAGRNVNALCSYYDRTAKSKCEFAKALSKIGGGCKRL